jgi:diguanylate cyclase (GGDEF)-like protein
MPTAPHKPLSFATGLSRGLRRWLRRRRRQQPSARSQGKALLTSLLLLSPLLALELIRRGAEVGEHQRLERQEALEVLHVSLAALRRTTSDWAHWNDTYAYLSGRNPSFPTQQLLPAPIFSDGSVMLLFTRSGRLVHRHGRVGDPSSGDAALLACAAATLPSLANPADPKVIHSSRSLLCRGEDGRFFLGIASPVSDSQGLQPAQGTLVLLSPLLGSDHGPYLLDSLSRLAADFTVVPATAGTTPPTAALEAVSGERLHTSGGLVGLRSQGLWKPLARSVADQGLLLLLPLLLLGCLRLLLQRDRQRQHLSQRRLELRASRRLRRICRELESLLQQRAADAPDSPAEAQVLSRLIAREPAAVDVSPAPPPRPKRAAPLPEDERLASRLRQLRERLQHVLDSSRRLALEDPLTGLPNRRYFLEYLALESERQLAHQGHLAILFVDVDRFKEINDNHGHAIGDQVLVGVASRLQELMRSGDFLARYGGDEFLVLMPLRPASPENRGQLRRDAHGMASRIAAGFDTPLDFGAVGLTITLSIGVAIVNPAKTSPQQAMQRSDAAMYQAKLQKLGRIAIFEADDPSWSAEEFQASERLPAL